MRRLKTRSDVDPRLTHHSEHGAELTPDEIEFGRAMDRYKREHNRPHPTAVEVLQVAKSLGYRKEK